MTILIAAVALNNLACIILVDLSRTLAQASFLPTETSLATSLLIPLGNIALSLLLGFIVGVLLVVATHRIVRTDRLAAMSLIAILLTTGLTAHLELSVLLACLGLGMFDAIMEGESKDSTCVGEGPALPHARLDIGDKILER